MLNYVVKISVMSAEYFEYYTIILGGPFFRGHAVLPNHGEGPKWPSTEPYCFATIHVKPLVVIVMQDPVYLHQGDKLVVHFWRLSNPKNVWYEWCTTEPVARPIHNPKGRSYTIGL